MAKYCVYVSGIKEPSGLRRLTGTSRSMRLLRMACCTGYMLQPARLDTARARRGSLLKQLELEPGRKHPLYRLSPKVRFGGGVGSCAGSGY